MVLLRISKTTVKVSEKRNPLSFQINFALSFFLYKSIFGEEIFADISKNKVMARYI